MHVLATFATRDQESMTITARCPLPLNVCECINVLLEVGRCLERKRKSGGVLQSLRVVKKMFSCALHTDLLNT